MGGAVSVLIKNYFDRVLPRCSPLWRNMWQILWTQKGCQQSSRGCPGRGALSLQTCLKFCKSHAFGGLLPSGACAVLHRAHHSPTRQRQRSAVLVRRAWPKVSACLFNPECIKLSFKRKQKHTCQKILENANKQKGKKPKSHITRDNCC